MVVKAKKRKQGPDKKNTTVTFGGMNWTSERAEVTLKRAGKDVSELTGIFFRCHFAERIVT
jgi:hypothetical protein